MALWFLLTIPSVIAAQVASTSERAKPGSVIAQLSLDAEAVMPLIQAKWVREWAGRAGELPKVEPFEIKIGETTRTVDEADVYIARWGSPLAYCRALDLAAAAGLDGLKNRKVLDFGFGSIGQLQLMALAGADVEGVDIDPRGAAMFAKFQGPIGPGRVATHLGKFPAEPSLVEKIGGDFDLVISKNTLKRGYIHPSRPVDPARTIQLGTSDEEFLAAIFRILESDGLFVIYNLCPAKATSEQPYIPWADGESPFSVSQFKASGFDVIAFDVIDNASARQLGHALQWDGPEAGMNLEKDLFAWYTIVRKPRLGK